MKGDVIPDGDHVTRLCGGSHVREDGTTSATAFKPRPGEAYLSVNWPELLALGDRAVEITEVRRVLVSKRTIGASARFAVLNVGTAREAVRQHSHDHRAISNRHEPEADASRPLDPSHSGIYGVPEDDMIIPELLTSVVQDVQTAR